MKITPINNYSSNLQKCCPKPQKCCPKPPSFGAIIGYNLDALINASDYANDGFTDEYQARIDAILDAGGDNLVVDIAGDDINGNPEICCTVLDSDDPENDITIPVNKDALNSKGSMKDFLISFLDYVINKKLISFAVQLQNRESEFEGIPFFWDPSKPPI